jgi:hypothetical protein
MVSAELHWQRFSQTVALSGVAPQLIGVEFDRTRNRRVREAGVIGILLNHEILLRWWEDGRERGSSGGLWSKY